MAMGPFSILGQLALGYGRGQRTAREEQEKRAAAERAELMQQRALWDRQQASDRDFQMATERERRLLQESEADRRLRILAMESEERARAAREAREGRESERQARLDEARLGLERRRVGVAEGELGERRRARRAEADARRQMAEAMARRPLKATPLKAVPLDPALKEARSEARGQLNSAESRFRQMLGDRPRPGQFQIETMDGTGKKLDRPSYLEALANWRSDSATTARDRTAARAGYDALGGLLGPAPEPPVPAADQGPPLTVPGTAITPDAPEAVVLQAAAQRYEAMVDALIQQGMAPEDAAALAERSVSAEFARHGMTTAQP